MSRPLDSYCELSLMLCAVACDPAGKYLSSLRDILLKSSYIFIIDSLSLLTTEYAYLTSSTESAHLSGASGSGILTFGLLECHRLNLLLFLKSVQVRASYQLNGSPSSSTPSGIFMNPSPISSAMPLSLPGALYELPPCWRPSDDALDSANS